MKTILAASGFTLLAGMAMAETPILNVLTYDSFVTEWGPGPAIEAAFEAECGCDLRFTPAGDGAALLARLRLEGAASTIDVVLGLDTNLTASATATGLFAPHAQSPSLSLPIAWDDPVFLPYDWGWFAFVHQADTAFPADFKALADSDLKIVIQDPRSSTPGLGLVLWVEAAYGKDAPAIWQGLADNILTVTPGWSEAYELFLSGEADAVLSYTTSPAYHLIAESDATKAAAAMAEGNYLQIEVMGRLAASGQPELADRFLAFMLSPAAQAVLPVTNWMYPAITPPEGLPKGFETLAQPAKSLLMSAAEAEAARGPAIDAWAAALAQ